MTIADIAVQYFTHESRVASFQTSSKRRQSNASTRGSKTLKWPHQFLSGEQLAKAGFFYHPQQSNPDNVACFLCHKSLDGWEEGDDPLAEHLKHSPDCGWAIVASIERDDAELSQEYPCSARMIEARKATFTNLWPHEGKKGWKCKTKQLVDAGWKFTPTPESDDMATCTYCGLSLDGWEPSDKPLDEHFKRSPECPFFALITDHKQSPAVSRTKPKRGRTSKASRLSTQSAFTVAPNAPALGDLPAEEGNSVLTTATNATAITQAGLKMGRKKAVSTKGKQTRAKKNEAVELEQLALEPEDDDFSVKVDLTPKTNRGKKRKSEQLEEPLKSATAIVEAPPAKRRTTRTRGSTAVDVLVLGSAEALQPASQPTGRKTRPSSRPIRKASGAASVASLRVEIPNDDELDQALQADLDRQVSDDDGRPTDINPPLQKSTRAKAFREDHAMFAPAPMEIDEAVIDAEMEALEVESKSLTKAKGAKGKQPRKVSAKQQAAARKAAETEAEAEAERLAEHEASQQMAAELEHSISMQHSSPVIQPQRQRPTSRQSSQQLPARRTRGSAMPVNDHDVSMASNANAAVPEDHDGFAHEMDTSIASQSTVVRGAAARRGSTLKKGRAGKTAASRNIEEIVQEPAEAVEPLEEAAPKPSKETSAKSKGRAAKASLEDPAPVLKSIETEPVNQPRGKAAKGKAIVQSPRLVSPAPREITPAPSPQSSDAENHPPSSKPSLTAKKPSTPHTNTTRIPLAATPMLSPSKRNVIAGLQSTQPWTAVDLDMVFLKSPSDENHIGLLADDLDKVKNGELTGPERKMTVEEWIHYNAQVAEEKLRNECERMVGIFESEGTRAMRALEGVECVK